MYTLICSLLCIRVFGVIIINFSKIGINKGKTCRKDKEAFKWKAHGAIYTECSHMYINLLLIDEEFCESQNVSIKFPCVHLIYFSLSSEDLLIFSVTSFIAILMMPLLRIVSIIFHRILYSFHIIIIYYGTLYFTTKYVIFMTKEYRR